MGAPRKWRSARDFGDVMTKMRPVHRLVGTLSFRTLIAAKDAIFLTPFTNRLRIGPGMVKFGPPLAAVRVWM